MPVKLIGKAVDILTNLLYKAVEDREAKLVAHGVKSGKLLDAQRKAYHLARKELELDCADKAIQLTKSLDEAKKALSGLK